MSIQDIQQNPQDTSNFYLANIYEAIADPNRSNISSSFPSSPPSFSPPNYAVWVNGLWFLSLAISITCALLATLLQQWARRYLKVTQTRYSLHKRARTRSFFAEGVEKSFLRLAVEALPTLIHVSLFLFFAGLILFLWNVNLTIFKLVLSWVGVCTALYGCITFIPIFLHDSPYYTPLTPLARLVVAAILSLLLLLCAGFTVFFILFQVFSSRCYEPVRILSFPGNWLMEAWHMVFLAPEEAALKSPPKIDTRALMWTFDILDEDHELERFFSGLPGFCSSKVVNEPLCGLNYSQNLQLLTSMIGLLDRTFSSDLLTDRIKSQRTNICANAIDLVDTPNAFPGVLRRLASEEEHGPVQSTEIVHFVRRWGNLKGEYPAVVQAIFSVVVARVQRHDDFWFSLASAQLGIPEAVLREHAAHGDSLSLAILIYITHQQFIYLRNRSWPLEAISNVLEVASKLNMQDTSHMQDTSPELQHKFCALWNQAVHKAQNDDDWKVTWRILRPIRNIFITLHHDTDSTPTRFSTSTSNQDEILKMPSSYPMCNVASHVHGDSTSTSLAFMHDNAVLSPTSLAGPVVPSIPLPDALRVDESIATVQLLDNSQPSSPPAHQTFKTLHIPDMSPDSAIASAMQDTLLNKKEKVQDFVTSGITMPHTTRSPETSTSSPPLFSTSRPAAIPLQHNAAHLPPFNPPDLPYSAPSNPVLDNILPTGLMQPSHTPLSRSDLSLSFSGSHCSMIVTTAPRASSGPTSAPDLGVSVEHDSRNTLDLPLVNRAIDASTIATPQPPSLSSVTDSDVAIVGRSLREQNAEHTADHPPGPSCYRYNMV